MPTRAELEQLLDLIERLTNSSDGTWQSRRKALMDLATEDQTVSLAEFSAWFAYDDLGDLQTPSEEPPQ